MDELSREPDPGSSAGAFAVQAARPPRPRRPVVNLVLFVATVGSVFLAGAGYSGAEVTTPGWMGVLAALASGWRFAVPLLAILVTHELGHYVAARIHRVDASLPYFIPMPFNPFGTMGAVISMRDRIRSRNALLDIGAAGPLAGLLVALPVLVVGLSHSPVAPWKSPGVLEGQSLLYLALKRAVLGPIPEGHDVFLGPVAFAGWTGLFVTALNLLPVGQLDGGHVAYALFGPRQNRYARVVHWGLLAMFVYNAAVFVGPVAMAGRWDDLGDAVNNSTFWLVWFVLLFVVARFGGRDHPPTEPGELTPARKWIAGATLVLFVLLFMPTPWSVH